MARPFVKYLVNLIANGETTPVLNILYNFLPDEQASIKDTCTLHQSALKKNDRDFQGGLITEEMHNQVISRINSALLDILHDIETLTFDDEEAMRQAKTIKHNRYEDDKTIGNVKEIKRRKLLKYVVMGGVVLAFSMLLGWYVKEKWIPIKNVPPSVTKTATDSLVAAEALLHEAENRRAVLDYEACITQCQEAIKWNNRNAAIYNQLSECYLYKGEITAAFENAKKAYKCDSIDASGMIMSTLAQVYGEMGNTKYFYIYTEESLKRGLEVWDFEDELGFNKYKEEAQFKKLIKKYKR